MHGRHAPPPAARADVEAIFANHRRYAALHNYTYIVQTAPLRDDDGSEVGVYWTKVHFLRTLLRPPHTCEWLLWIDSDAAFINLKQPIERLLRDPANHIALAPGTRPSVPVTQQTGWNLASLLDWLSPRPRNAALSPSTSSSSSSDSDSSSRRSSNSSRSSNAPSIANATWFPATSLVFSGDTNAINAGVLLLRRTNYARHLLDEVVAIGAKLRRANVTVGMGSDNAAFAIFLGGCTSATDHRQYSACYDRVDVGYMQTEKRRNKEVWRRIIGGDRDTFVSMVHPSVWPHVAPVKQRDFQAYKMEKANFILHFVGNKRTHKRQELLAVLKALNQ